MKLRLSRRAQADLARIAVYIFEHDPRAALAVEDQLAAALRLLTVHPAAGRIVGPRLGRFVVPRLPYLIFYRVEEADDVVAVAIIRHTSRRPIPQPGSRSGE